MKTLFRKLKSSRVARFALWSLIGISLPLLWWSLPLFTDPPAIIVSPETTHVPDKWINNGAADYQSYVTDLLFPDGQIPKIKHPWRVVPEEQRFASFPDFIPLIDEISGDPERFNPPEGVGDGLWAWKIDYCYSVIAHQPWPAELFPEIAEIIES